MLLNQDLGEKGEEEILRGFVEVASQYSKSISEASTKTDNFVNNSAQNRIVFSPKYLLILLLTHY